MPILKLSQVSKTYPVAKHAFVALDRIDLVVEPGEFLAVVGRSGSGKTTLLNLVAGIDRCSSGDVVVAGTNITELGESALAQWRGRTVGLVFQFFQLLPSLTVRENVVLAMDFVGSVPQRRRRARASELLDRLEIGDQRDKRPSALSGGQQQRAAIARALANDPPILLGDEPTGNLDSGTAATVLRLFAELSAEGRTIVLVSHDPAVQRVATRCLELVDGRWADPR